MKIKISRSKRRKGLSGGRSIIVRTSPPGGTSFHGTAKSYESIYSSNAAVRTVLDWLGRQVARYEPRSFMRVNSGNGETWNPVSKDAAAQLFRDPFPGASRFELVRWLITSVGLSGNAYGVMVADDAGKIRQLVPVPSSTVSLEGPSGDEPSRYVVQLATGPKEYPREDILHVKLFNPANPSVGVSPLDSLRALLAEDEAASKDRQRYFRDAGRLWSWITRPLEAEPMSEEALEAFLLDINASHSGDNAGLTGFLDEGMSFHEGQGISAKDAAFVEGREQVLRAVAAAFGVPHQLVNTASENLSAAARLVEYTLSPYVELLEDAINAQLTPRLFGDQAAGGRIVVRLMQPASLTDRDAVDTVSGAVKSALITANEGRRIFGLATHADGDKLTAQQPTMPVAP